MSLADNRQAHPPRRGRPPNDAVRAEFVDAAIALLSGKGRASGARKASKGGRLTSLLDEPLSVRLVAKAAGRAHATAALFHFPDRVTLLAAVAARAFWLLIQELESASSGHPRRAVALVASRYVRWGVRNQRLFATMYDPSLAHWLELAQLARDRTGLEEELIESGDSEDTSRKRARAFWDLLTAKAAALNVFVGAVVRDQSNGADLAGDPLRVAHAFTAMADGLVWQLVMEQQGRPEELLKHADRCIDLLSSGAFE